MATLPDFADCRRDTRSRPDDIEADLVAALARGEIGIVLQPQFDLVSDELVGAEALARWKHPRVGTIGADALFTVAERAGQAAQLSRHIAVSALAAARVWPKHLRLSLNVTPAELAEPGCVMDLLGLLAEAEFAADRLTLEITEQVLIDDLDGSAGTLAALKRAGMSIALDDFGAGFCNFRYLKVLPLDTLKLDRSMIVGIEHDDRDLAVLRAIVALARALDMSVVAEGIETEGQRLVASREGCATYQGFLRAVPLSPAAFLALAGEDTRLPA
ncbi:EAL domain-containing protein [Tsuneonella rigui]|uniref:EAL domain-containing protein n=1 Tax=Tsuneonella rigui TaxID=1708790 RepID=UPI000F7DC905|nr:EAL domain-containing protein [Tsuneonella rigui]